MYWPNKLANKLLLKPKGIPTKIKINITRTTNQIFFINFYIFYFILIILTKKHIISIRKILSPLFLTQTLSFSKLRLENTHTLTPAYYKSHHAQVYHRQQLAALHPVFAFQSMSIWRKIHLPCHMIVVQHHLFQYFANRYLLVNRS